ncbi:MAG: hypothetical protein ACTSPY_08960 [Candidatus Helarchaeota archaeon]
MSFIKSKSLIISLLFLFYFVEISILSVSIPWHFNSNFNIAVNDSVSNSCSESGVILNTFPVDLDLLFWNDNLTMQNYKLNLIGNDSSNFWMLSPWGGHFISSHIEGLDHWYCFTLERPLAVRVPHDGTLFKYTIKNESIRYVNGTKVLADTKIIINIGSYCYISLGHVCVLKSLSDYLISHPYYHFTEGEIIGYTRPSNGTVTLSDSPQLDFWYLKNIMSITGETPLCPYCFLSDSLKTKVKNLYDLQYNRAKVEGTYPESKICNPYKVDFENTFWGSWLYLDGPYNSYITDEVSSRNYEGGKLVFLFKKYLNNETFYRDPRNKSKNLPSDLIGLATDSLGNSLPNYKYFGKSLVFQIEGNNQSGILQIVPYNYSELNDNESLYARFSIEFNNVGLNDDVLKIEYFTNLTLAQSGFTNNCIKYQRFWSRNSLSIPSFSINWLIIGLLWLLIIKFIPFAPTSKHRSHINSSNIKLKS